jgi:nucleoside-diphosphate-sugar epimerase
MRILVTGGAGYLGSVLVPALLEQGHTVRVLDALRHEPGTLLSCFAYHTFSFVRGDVREAETLKRALDGVEAIIPLAALVGMPICKRQPREAREVNFEAIALLNELRAPEQRVLFPNSNSGYGTKSGEVYCTEDSPLEPISLYGQTKVEAERLLLAAPNTLAFRFATLFGVSPRVRLDLLVNDFAYRARRDRYLVLYEKDYKRNYLHIHDAARCFVHALEHWDEMVGRVYNAGLEEANLSKLELALLIKQFLPDLVIYEEGIGRDPDQRNYVVSNARLYATGYRPIWTLEQGIRQLLSAYEMLPPEPWRNA